MRNKVKDIAIIFMKDKVEVKLIDLAKHLIDNGFVNNTSGYMSTFHCLTNNIQTFEKTRTGYYKLRPVAEQKELVSVKPDTVELSEKISQILNNKYLTPAQVCLKLRHNNIIHSYKQVWSILNGVDFSTSPRKFTEQKWGSVYTKTK